MSETIKCWPTRWLMAAQEAGLAQYEVATGAWHFQSDAMRDRLEVFGKRIWEAAEDEARPAPDLSAEVAAHARDLLRGEK